MLTTEEVLEILKISRATLYRLVSQGKLTQYKIGNTRRTYYKKEEVEGLFQPVERDTAPQTENDSEGVIEPQELLAA